MEWEPLSDIWDNYLETIEQATRFGGMDSPEEAESVIWPQHLYLADTEKEDINKFIIERTNEITNLIQNNMQHGVKATPQVIASYLFRSVLSGMIWEQERIGN